MSIEGSLDASRLVHKSAKQEVSANKEDMLPIETPDQAIHENVRQDAANAIQEQRSADQKEAAELLKKMYGTASNEPNAREEELSSDPNGWMRELRDELKLKEAERQAQAKLEARTLTERQTSTSPHEQVIRTHEALQTSELGGGVNKTEFVQLKDDGSIVFKPISGETRVGDNINAHIEAGTYYKRERAAYLVSEYFGLNLVPPTVIRELHGETGSAQEFIPNAKLAYEVLGRDRFSMLEKINIVGKRRDNKYKNALNKLFVFDHLIWNFDRHLSNFLLKDGEIHAIDNGFAFNKIGDNDHLRWSAHVSGFYYDKEVPADVAARLQEFVSRPEAEEELRLQMEGLLSDEEIDALVYRAKEIAKKALKDPLVSSSEDMLTTGEWNIKFNNAYES